MSKNDEMTKLLAQIFALKYAPKPKPDDMSQAQLKDLLANYEQRWEDSSHDLTEPTRQQLADKIKDLRSRITL